MTKAPRSLEQLLTFSRASAAGYFGRDGKFVWQQPSRNVIAAPVSLWANTHGWSPVTAPDGSMNAVKTTDSSTSAQVSAISLLQTSFARCFSGYIYAPGFAYLYMYFRWAGTGSYIYFDKNSMAAVNPPSGVTAGIQDAGGGWYRIFASHETKFSGSNASLYLGATDVVGSSSNVFNGREIHFWGAQLENADFPTPYVAPGYSPRIEWGPDGKRKGLLIEGSSTNLGTQSEFQNGLTDAPTRGGTVAAATFAGLLLGSGVSMGPTPSGNPTSYLYKHTTLATNTTYTLSTFVRVEGGGAPTANDLQGAIQGIPNVSPVFEHIFGDLYRAVAVMTSSSTTPTLWGFQQAAHAAARKVYLSGYQIEAKPYATSYIPTTTAQVTRAADRASIEGQAFSAWFSRDEGTMYVNASIVRSPRGTSSGIFSLSNNSAGESISSFFSPDTSNVSSEMVDNGAVQASFSKASSSNVKIAFAVKSNDTACSVNGSAPITDTNCTIPTVDRLILGSAYTTSSFPLGGYIKDFRYFPKRLSNEALVALTS